MSQGWEGGSTRAWRKVREYVLQRDGYTCRLQIEGCTRIANHAHHTHGRSVTGDDPNYIIASCQNCNLKIGDPTKSSIADPKPKPSTKW